MRYWLNLFSLETWEDFREHESSVTGFRENNWTRAKRIQFGDVFLCYIIGAKRWVGSLRVVGDRYLDQENEIFRENKFPVRFRVEPIVVLEPELGVPMELLRGRLSFFPLDGNYKDWSGYVRSSPTVFADEDGAAIDDALEKAAINPARVPIDPKAIAMTRRKKKKAPQQNLWVCFGSGSLPRLCRRANFATFAVRNPYDFLVTNFTLLFRPSTAPDETSPLARNQFRIKGR